MSAPTPVSPAPSGPTGVLGRAVEWAAPARMGVPFRWLLGANSLNNLGDGLAVAAGPLLVASQTHDPFLVSLAPMLQKLPTMVMGLGVGALADRIDRKRLILLAGAMRALVLVALVAIIVTGQVSIWGVLAMMLLLGVAEAFTDVVAGTILPSIVDPDDLVIGNARLMAGFLVLNNLVGPPLGAFLFAAGMAWPFLAQAVCVALALVLLAQMAVPPLEARESTSVVTDIVEGVRWLAGHAAVRTLILTILTFNVTWAAAWGVLVLWAQQRVGLGPVGYGLLMTASAIGGLISVVTFDAIAARFSFATIMRVCLSLEVLMHLVLATTRSSAVAFVTMFVFGLYAFTWHATSTAVRQRATPQHLMGRVGSVNMVGVMGGMVIGMPLGGWIASHWGITAPYWFAFVGSGLTLLLIWRALGHLADDAGDAAAAA